MVVIVEMEIPCKYINFDGFEKSGAVVISNIIGTHNKKQNMNNSVQVSLVW